MRRVGPSFLVAVVVLLCGRSVSATTIGINDTFADNHIGLSIVLTPDTTNGTVSANCTIAGVNQWNCSEGAPMVIDADILRSGSSLHDTNFNIWDDHVGGTISDTLSFAFSSITPTSAHATITFQSGAGVTAFAPAPNTLNGIEGAPLVITLDGSRDGGTFTLATTPVPEPATLTLTALGFAGVISRHRRRRGSR